MEKQLNNGYYRTDLKPYIVINTIDELMNFINDVDNDVVVSNDTIIIYDDYLE